MDAKTAIKDGLSMADMVSMAYLSDLSDEELMKRPHAKCNHLNWQVGHLIAAENHLVSLIAPDQMPSLPEGFAEKYSKERAASDDATAFSTKEELMKLHQQQRAGTLKVLDSLSEADLDAPSGVEYAPTKGAIISMQGSHWLMHSGQWAVVRRQCDKPVVI